MYISGMVVISLRSFITTAVAFHCGGVQPCLLIQLPPATHYIAESQDECLDGWMDGEKEGERGTVMQ